MGTKLPERKQRLSLVLGSEKPIFILTISAVIYLWSACVAKYLMICLSSNRTLMHCPKRSDKWFTGSVEVHSLHSTEQNRLKLLLTFTLSNEVHFYFSNLNVCTLFFLLVWTSCNILGYDHLYLLLLKWPSHLILKIPGHSFPCAQQKGVSKPWKTFLWFEQ